MFKEKICVITGASSGLGKTLALTLAKEQANLVLFSRNQEKLQIVAAECQQLGASACHVIIGDVTQPADCERLVSETIAKFQRIDYLINNAGISMWAPFVDIQDLSVFEKLIAVNYLGAVYCTHYALPYLKQSQGMIVAISSLQGKVGVPFHTGYSAAKHALQGFFDALRIELAGSGVDVLVASPSWLQGTNLRENSINVGDKKLFRQSHSDSGMSLAECCQYILTAMQKRKRDLLLPKKAKILFWVRAVCPRVADWYIARRVNKET